MIPAPQTKRRARRLWFAVGLALAAVLVIAGGAWVWREREADHQRVAEGLRLRDQMLRAAEGAQRAWRKSTSPEQRQAQRDVAMREFHAAEAEIRRQHELATLQRGLAASAAAAAP